MSPGLQSEVTDVMFLAFAMDGEGALGPFLEKKPFKYNIVPSSQETIGKFKVTSYPTHIILDREGNINTILFGGGEDRHEELRPLIRRLLSGAA